MNTPERQLRGVLCDLDGTLLDSECLHLEAWAVLLGRFGCTPPDTWNDDCIGLPDAHAASKAQAMFPILANENNLVAEKEVILRALLEKKGLDLPYPGVKDGLTALAAAGAKLAVGTNTVERNSRVSLDRSGLKDLFPVLVSSDMVGKSKPEPDIYLEAARRLGLDPTACVVIEDSTAGIEAGKRAGCLVIAVENTWTGQRLAKADMILPNTPKALSWILAALPKEGATARK